VGATSTDELPEDLTLTPGERRQWALPNLGGGGYRWQADTDGTAVTAHVSLTEEPTQTGPGPPAPGSWRGQVLTVQGAAPGTAVVRLVHRRPWEDVSLPAQSRMIKVTVAPTGGADR
jgi:predicted secreted protein